MTAIPELDFRAGTPDDVDWLLGLFDGAVAWLVARGQPGQWGTEPFSASAPRHARVAGMCADGTLRVGSLDGEAVGALAVGACMPYIEPIDRPELYIRLLLVSRAHAGRRIGEALVRRALTEARAGGAEVVRVDCWAGAPTLVAWYEARGFRPAARFAAGEDWTGQLFELAL